MYDKAMTMGSLDKTIMFKASLVVHASNQHSTENCRDQHSHVQWHPPLHGKDDIVSSKKQSMVKMGLQNKLD